ncbi:hypothetical protein, partial [Escherichia coli]|uniref:hypothetical protein n=1 Tax=Escherichia coli TaxID=562 RepID=UPI0013B39028
MTQTIVASTATALTVPVSQGELAVYTPKARTEKDVAKVSKLKNTIVLSDTQTVLGFGVDAQKRVTEISN